MKFYTGAHKAYRITVLWGICLAVMLFLCLSACTDKSYASSDDYIEVTGLRISSADVKMSSSGDPSTYQLSVEVVPSDATNRQVTYYIPSEYHKYVTISETGLLTAHNVSEGTQIPVTITSTTNSSASLKVNVLVEDVAVQRINFTTDYLSMLHKGDTATVSVAYTPSHAIDGRSIAYSSLNTAVATVTDDGVVTPVGVGNTRIKALSSPRSGFSKEAYLPVTVYYAEGQYQLSVSGNASFNQVIGDFSDIDFTLLCLGNNVDPNPSIEWYVDTERQSGMSDCIQYTHTPTATTQLSYHVYVYVTAYGHDTVKLESPTITIYKPFTGINLVFDNLSSVYTPYIYGQTATFELKSGDSSTITEYDWYLSETGGDGHEIEVASTLPSNKNLTRRINVTGDYSLGVRGVDGDGNLVSNSTQFVFSSEKFSVGDTLCVSPSLIGGGLPPDSYHWYVVKCDENGNYSASGKQLVADTASDETFYYRLTENGYFRFLVTASLSGVAATVDGSPYTYEGDVIRVFSQNETDTAREDDLLDTTVASNADFSVNYDTEITDIGIEGIVYDGENDVLLTWNNVCGVRSYIVELTFADKIVLLDSAEGAGGVFGSNYCYLYNSTATLASIFSVRIKQKNSRYSERYFYGTLNDKGLADETHVPLYPTSVYPYFAKIALNNASVAETSANASVMNAPALNAYVRDMEELRKLCCFALLYTPSSNSYIIKGNYAKDGVLYDTYSLKVYIPFSYTDAIAAEYPSGIKDEDIPVDDEFDGVYKMIIGALKASPYIFDASVGIEGADNEYTLTFSLKNGRADTLSYTDEIEGNAATQSLNFSDTAYGPSNAKYPIDLMKEVYVYTSDQLAYVAELGYRPVPQTDSLSALYKKIKTAVASVVNVGMTDGQKLLAIYDWLTLNVVYDTNIASPTSLSDDELYGYASFRLEGVFNKKQAVDCGMAKAFAVMCAVAGIPCATVTAGTADGTRYLNRVTLGGKTYLADAAKGISVVDGAAVSDHAYFLVSENDYANLVSTEENTAAVYCGTETEEDSFDWFSNVKITDKYAVVRSASDLTSIAESVTKSGVYGLEILFDKTSFTAEAEVKELIEGLETQTEYAISAVLGPVYTTDAGLRVTVKLTVN